MVPWADSGRAAELNPKGAVQMPSRCFVILSLKPTELKASLLFTAPSARGQRLWSTPCAYQALNKAYASLIFLKFLIFWLVRISLPRFISPVIFICPSVEEPTRISSSFGQHGICLGGNCSHMLQAELCLTFSGRFVLMAPVYIRIRVYLPFTQTIELMILLMNGVWVWL